MNTEQKPNDGGPAFPLPYIANAGHAEEYYKSIEIGMTYRAFAAAVIAGGLAANPKHADITIQSLGLTAKMGADALINELGL